ncbi:Dynamitin-domain-containing protein [Scheffersomyces amazonensis]|uniref:Dynamitin-domain-containing protein n=1 Tax=Scheffersomyces amazonensis TaxID=1078765 RepID=UPI00315CD3D2
MEKYGELPDIDASAQDVFETSDVESVDGGGPDNESISSDIAGDSVDVSVSKNKFNQSGIPDVSGVNFSGSVDRKQLGRTGYVLYDGGQESRDEKLARIRRELDELSSESVDSEGSDIDRLVTRLEELSQGKDENKSSSTDHSDKLKAVFQTITDKVNGGNVSSSTEPWMAVNSTETLELESRLTKIEQLIGYDSLTAVDRVTDEGKSLGARVKELGLKVGIVGNPEYSIENIKNQVSQVRADMEAYDKERRLHQLKISTDGAVTPPTIPIDDKKISELHERLGEFDKVNKIVPLVVTRLKSLHSVHSDMATSIASVSSLDEVISSIKSELTAWNSSIDSLNDRLDKESSAYESNKVHIVSELQQLKDKVSQLSSQ